VKVVVAMSGGVDSSVAAALLKEEGYQVIGVTMQIWPRNRQSHGVQAYQACCGIDAVENARKVAYTLEIPCYVMNFRDIFARMVITDFYREYGRGRTPNPCLRCNQYIKFGVLLEKAMQLGADFVATGHYARIERGRATGRHLLKKGIDHNKDQSYFLFPLTQEQLSRSLFPIGDYTKGRVREIAEGLGLPVAHHPESQEICFVPDNDYPEFIKEYVPQAAIPGPILGKQGETLGRHHGILAYTIGQRRGLGIATREPLYVTAIEPDRNAIVVGNKAETYHRELTAGELNWISISRPERPITTHARIRYRHAEAAAEIIPIDEERVRVRFNEAQMAIAPGQAVVFYQEDTVVGGGIIENGENNERVRSDSPADNHRE